MDVDGWKEVTLIHDGWLLEDTKLQDICSSWRVGHFESPISISKFNAIKNIKKFIDLYFVCNSGQIDKPFALNGKILSSYRLHIWWMLTKLYVYHNVIFIAVYLLHMKKKEIHILTW